MILNREKMFFKQKQLKKKTHLRESAQVEEPQLLFLLGELI